MWARRILHLAHAVTSIALIGTGVLIEFPELRGQLIGGYGLQIAQLHLWAGWAFMAVPALALAVAPRPLVRHLRKQLGSRTGIHARQVLAIANLTAAILLAVSGVPLWLDRRLPLAVADASLEVHIALTWVLVALIPPHLFLSRRKIATRLLQLVGRGPERELG